MCAQRAFVSVAELFLAIAFILRPCPAQQLVSSSSPPSSDTITTRASILEAFRFYKQGNFDAAAAKYREVLQVDSKNSDAYVGLTRTLLKQKKLDEAHAALEIALQTADSPQLRVLKAEVHFRDGLIANAEREWVNVINSGHPYGRAFLGLARVSTALSLHKRAQTMLQKAYTADPEDADIRKAWMRTLKRSESVKFLQDYLAQDNADDAESRAHMKEYLEYLKARESVPTRACHLIGSTTSTEAPMVRLLRDANHLRGFGLVVDFGGQKSKLMLDTGAGGILIDRKIAEKAGLKQISANTVGGIGDRGEARGYVALAPSIKVGGLEFQDCPVEVIDRKSVVEEDGLIGADVFDKFLVNLDFAHEKLRLSELPKRPGQNEINLSLDSESDDQNSNENSSPAGQTSQNEGPFDHYIAPEMKDYTQVLKFGHALLIPTSVNDDKVPKFFLIDSGGFTTQLSLNAAKSVTKVHSDSRMQVRGISGLVDKVYIADDATLAFGHLRQPTKDILVLDLKHLSDNFGTEISGIIGFTTLRFLNINIDYRDGLVWMDYQGPKWLVQ